ncbi:hypothetical protein BO71DRAFT_486360 [Aspergillus ellipticus CBS 707.79]|uniref:Alpha/beta-hydrolase n=1 Tax=Aspergillus ellipticus CBS 707.79 TaxID=1448320 RepID=A0A319EK31_9EURO|nr:hypothetical protein BO71DRAFT_486360 [Aspergillus ellipticus CBS 707.79]
MSTRRVETATLLVGLALALPIGIGLWTRRARQISLNTPHPKQPSTFGSSECQEILDSLPDNLRLVDDDPDRPNILNWSSTPSALMASRFNGATVTFCIAPDWGTFEKILQRSIGKKAVHLIADADFVGPTSLADPGEQAQVDIVAVTGLSGHGFGSWRARGKPAMWLRDFLPEDIPNARIITYGYDTRLSKSQSNVSIRELGKDLLEMLKNARLKHAHRPLILIGHSLGGLVIKRALVEAARGNQEDRTVLISCYATLFFGVPNRGLRNEALISMVKGQPNEDLIRSLGQDSRVPLELSRRLLPVLPAPRLPGSVCLRDQGDTYTRGTSIPMVPLLSGIHAGPNEDASCQLSINANHSDLVKFKSRADFDYTKVARRIRGLASAAPMVVRERFGDSAGGELEWRS